MKKLSPLEATRKLLIRDGIAQISYRAAQLEDIVHPFSVPGYELLSESFVTFLERCHVLLPDRTPVMLELEGCGFSEEERETIDRAIRTHFYLNLSEARADWKDCLKKILCYSIFTFLSALLLFVTKQVSAEVLLNLMYLPFWFFGYRLVGLLILDCHPLLKRCRWYTSLASLKLVFASEQAEQPLTDAAALHCELKQQAKEAGASVRGNAFADEYLLDRGVVSLACTVNSLDDVLASNYPSGWSFLSDSMAAYLTQVLPFVKGNSRIELEISGGSFSESEQFEIQEGMRRFFTFRTAQEERENEANRMKVRFFSLFLLVSMLMLGCWGLELELATHEFVVLLFWFFGDYLLEFVLLNPLMLLKNRRKLESFAAMTVKFK